MKYMVYEKKIDGSTLEFGVRNSIESAINTINGCTRFLQRGTRKDTLYFFCLPMRED